AVLEDENGRRIQEHPERVLHRFIVPAKDADGFAVATDAVAILAEEPAVTEAFAHARNLRRQVIDPGREQHPAGFVDSLPADRLKNSVWRLAQFLDEIPRELRAEMPGLLAPARQQFLA